MHSTTRLLSIAGAATMAVALTACGSVDPYGSNNYPGPSASSYPTTSYPAPAGSYNQPVAGVEYGRVTDVRLISGPAAPRGNHIAGTAIGAIIGGVLGNQIGGGSGRSAATVLGAVGGAVVGNKIAQNQDGTYASNQTVYRISVQTDTGQMRTYDVSATGDLQPGDRVRVDNGVIYHA
ncbi:MAG: glycine zipper 2TM domain-containing protein [Ramlibacter sp.]